MKISIGDNSYIVIEKNNEAIKIGIKTKQGKESCMISASLEKEHIDSIISELITLRSRLHNVKEEVTDRE